MTLVPLLVAVLHAFSAACTHLVKLLSLQVIVERCAIDVFKQQLLDAFKQQLQDAFRQNVVLFLTCTS